MIKIKLKKVLYGLAFLGCMGTLTNSVISTNTVVEAKGKTTTKNKHKKAPVLLDDLLFYSEKMTGNSGYIYSNNNVSHKIGKLSQLSNHVFRVDHKAHYKLPNGSRHYYYHIKNNEISGFVLTKNLHRYHTAKKTHSSTVNNSSKNDNKNESSSKDTSQASINTAIQTALNQINKERQDRGLTAYTLDPTLNKIAQQRAQQISTNFSHYDSNGNFIFQQMVQNTGLSLSYIAENIGEDNESTLNKDVLSDIHEMMYNDADSNWGHRENFLSTQNNIIGIGIYVGADGNTYIAYDMGASSGSGTDYNSNSDGVQIGDNIFVGTDDPAHNQISVY